MLAAAARGNKGSYRPPMLAFALDYFDSCEDRMKATIASTRALEIGN
jgi:hypothetical protein